MAAMPKAGVRKRRSSRKAQQRRVQPVKKETMPPRVPQCQHGMMLAGLANAIRQLLDIHDVDASLNATLEHLGKASDVDRVVILRYQPELTGDLQTLRLTHEWCKPSLSPFLAMVASPAQLSFKFRKNILKKLMSGKPFSKLARQLPPAKRKIAESFGVRSFLLVPVLVNGKFWGLVGFDDCRHDRIWRADEISALSAIANAIGLAIQRHAFLQAWAEREQSLQQVIQAANDGIIEWNLNTDSVTYNERLAQILDLKETRFLSGQNAFQKYVHPEDWPDIRKVLEQIKNGDRAHFEGELRAITERGDTKWLFVRAIVASTGQGASRRLHGIISDITERKRAEKAMQIQRDLAMTLSAVTRLEDALEHVLKAVLDVEGISGCGIYLVEETCGKLRLITQQRCPPSFVERVKELPLDSAIGQMVLTGQPVYTSLADAHWLRALASPDPSWRGVAVVPFKYGGKVLGTLTACSQSFEIIPPSSQLVLDGIVAAIGGVIARTRIEQELIRSQELFTAFMEHLPALAYITDSQSRLLYGNPSFMRLFSKSALGKTPLETPSIPRDTAERMLAQDQEVLKEGEKVFIRPQPVSGQPPAIFKECRFPIRREGMPVLLGSIVLDITEQVQSQKALERRTKMFEDLFEFTPAGLVAINPDGKIARVNRRAEEIFGIPREQLDGCPAESLFKEPYKTNFEKSLRTVMQEGHSHKPTPFLEAVIIRENGLEIPVELMLTRIDTDEGPLALSIIQDVSEHRRAVDQTLIAMEQQREFRRLQSTFISLVSHEFRTPLSAILNATEMLEDFYDRLDPARRQAYFRMIKQEISQFSKLMEEVIYLGCFEAGKVTFTPEPVRLRELCKAAIAEACMLFPDGPVIQFECEIKDEWAMADRNLLHSILSNLLSNAMKYSPDKKPVILRLKQNSKQIELQVADNGIGIPVNEQSRLFQAFFRASNVGKVKGTGVGLRVVKHCVELHDGEIQFSSQPGRGTVFTVRIPFQGVKPDELETVLREDAKDSYY